MKWESVLNKLLTKMNKKVATLILTEKLNKLDYCNIVFNPRIQNYLIKTAKSVIFNLEDTLGGGNTIC